MTRRLGRSGEKGPLLPRTGYLSAAQPARPAAELEARRQHSPPALGSPDLQVWREERRKRLRASSGTHGDGGGGRGAGQPRQATATAQMGSTGS